MAGRVVLKEIRIKGTQLTSEKTEAEILIIIIIIIIMIIIIHNNK